MLRENTYQWQVISVIVYMSFIPNQLASFCDKSDYTHQPPPQLSEFNVLFQ